MPTEKMNVVCHVYPRTGSTSLYRYLMIDSPPSTEEGSCWHVHYLVNKRHRWHGKRQFADVESLDRDAWKVITIIRDPIEATLSAFWRWRAKNVRLPDVPLADAFKAQKTTDYFMDTMNHWAPHWHIANEVEPFWGFNVYDTPFTPPYQILDDRLLLIKTEDLDEFAIPALEEFLGYEMTEPGFPHHSPSRKLITLNLNEDYIHAMYQHLHVEHFWTEDEVNAMCESRGVKGFSRAGYKDAYSAQIMTPDDERLKDLEAKGVIIRPVRAGENLDDHNVVLVGEFGIEDGEVVERWEDKRETERSHSDT